MFPSHDPQMCPDRTGQLPADSYEGRRQMSWYYHQFSRNNTIETGYSQCLRPGELIYIHTLIFPDFILYFIFVSFQKGGLCPVLTPSVNLLTSLRKCLILTKTPQVNFHPLLWTIYHWISDMDDLPHIFRQTNYSGPVWSGLINFWSDQFQIIPCLAFPCLAWKL